jgi:hypothetical protein
MFRAYKSNNAESQQSAAETQAKNNVFQQVTPCVLMQLICFTYHTDSVEASGGKKKLVLTLKVMPLLDLSGVLYQMGNNCQIPN